MLRKRRLRTAELRIGGLERREIGDSLVLFTARRWGERRDGLAGLESLPDDWGLHILRCRSVHTLGMRFALDLLWLDGEGAVVRIDHDVAPRRQRSCRSARTVVEVAAGRGEQFAAALRGGH